MRGRKVLWLLNSCYGDSLKWHRVRLGLDVLNCTSYTQIWDAVGGILKGVFKGITEADITAVCLDDR